VKTFAVEGSQSMIVGHPPRNRLNK